MRAILFRMLEPSMAGRTPRIALDAGCGTGYLSHLLQKERRWPMVAMDGSARGLRYARQMGLDRAVQGDVAALPFRDRSFDLLLSLDVMVHLPRGTEQGAAREMARVLAPGGLLVIRTAALELLRSRHSIFVGEQQRFTRRRLVNTVRTAGLRVRRCTYVNSLLLPAALVKFRIWEPLLRREPASGVAPVARWLDRLLYAPLALEAAWIRAGGGFPLGQTLILIAEKTA